MSPTDEDRKIQSDSRTTFQPSSSTGRMGAGAFAAAVASALQKEFGGTHGAIKRVVGLTAANERAVKNWFEGRNGPSGEFLILLCRHSDQVLETVLLLAGRTELVTAKKLVDAKGKLREMLILIDEIESSNRSTDSA